MSVIVLCFENETGIYVCDYEIVWITNHIHTCRNLFFGILAFFQLNTIVLSWFMAESVVVVVDKTWRIHGLISRRRFSIKYGMCLLPKG